MTKYDVFRDQKIPQNSKVDPRYFPPLYHNSLANSKIQMKFSHSSVEIQTIQIILLVLFTICTQAKVWFIIHGKIIRMS